MLEGMNRFLSLCALSLVGVLVLSGCSAKSDTSSSSSPGGTQAGSTSTTSGGTGTSSDGSTTSDEPFVLASLDQVLSVDVSFDDPETGDNIDIFGFAPIFKMSSDSEKQFGASLNGGTVSLISMEITASDYITLPITADRFLLTCGDNVGVAPQTTPFAADMETVGLPPFPDEGVQASEIVDYWIAYLMPGNPDPTGCSVTYTRPATDDFPEGFTNTVQLN